jgi:hypothetical protein
MHNLDVEAKAKVLSLREFQSRGIHFLFIRDRETFSVKQTLCLVDFLEASSLLPTLLYEMD